MEIVSLNIAFVSTNYHLLDGDVCFSLSRQSDFTKMLEYVERTVYFLKNFFLEGASSYCVLNEAFI